MNYYGYRVPEEVMCEWCEKDLAVDVNHISPRGMGGKNPSKDVIENLIALCRICHNMFEAKGITKEEMKEKHLNNL
jgi:predicted restriction endonuclease